MTGRITSAGHTHFMHKLGRVYDRTTNNPNIHALVLAHSWQQEMNKGGIISSEGANGRKTPHRIHCSFLENSVQWFVWQVFWLVSASRRLPERSSFSGSGSCRSIG